MTHRIPLDDLTSDQLDQLYDRLEFTEATLARMRDRAEVATVRAARAEAELDRLREDLTFTCSTCGTES
jgi:hypothetical protein